MNAQPDNSREETYREARKQIVRSAFLALAALGVIVFACYAWFVSSGTVTGTVGSVRIDGSSFELASEGGVGVYDNLMPTDCTEPGENWKLDENTPGKITGEKSDILWRISSDSNLENGKGQTGISPGSHGQMQFYIIPKRNGDLTLKFDIELAPLDKYGKQITMQEDKTLNWLLRGHFLFAYECKEAQGFNQNNTPTLIAYNNSFFNLTFKSVKEDEPIRVTLYWTWPLLLKNIIQNDLFDNVEVGPAVQGWMKATPDHFFYDEGKPISEPDFDNFTQQFRQYNNCYNNADQYIGDKVQSLILRLTAEET